MGILGVTQDGLGESLAWGCHQAITPRGYRLDPSELVPTDLIRLSRQLKLIGGVEMAIKRKHKIRIKALKSSYAFLIRVHKLSFENSLKCY